MRRPPTAEGRFSAYVLDRYPSGEDPNNVGTYDVRERIMQLKPIHRPSQRRNSPHNVPQNLPQLMPNRGFPHENVLNNPRSGHQNPLIPHIDLNRNPDQNNEQNVSFHFTGKRPGRVNRPSPSE